MKKRGGGIFPMVALIAVFVAYIGSASLAPSLYPDLPTKQEGINVSGAQEFLLKSIEANSVFERAVTSHTATGPLVRIVERGQNGYGSFLSKHTFSNMAPEHVYAPYSLSYQLLPVYGRSADYYVVALRHLII